jgi:hypothetical protein
MNGPPCTSTALTSLAVSAAFCAAVLVAGCVDEQPPADDSLGVFSFALTGVIPGVKAMDVKVFAGPVTNMSKQHKFELACIPYVTGPSKSNNAFTLDKLPARDDYSILVNLYADDLCADLRVRGYRGGITVAAGGRPDAADSPYYIQPYRLGQFTGLATANPLEQAKVQKLSCSANSDCRGEGGHPAATCQGSKCSLSSLFPLNGGSPRAFPNVIGLSNGQIAISGGFTVVDADGTWSATKKGVEVFDPTVGRFSFPAASIDNFDIEARVGLATALPFGAATFAQVGGSAKIKLVTGPKTLKTGLLDAACAGTGDCPASKAVWLVDVATKAASGTLLNGHVSMPIVAHVATSNGPKVLVAGGVELPIQGATAPRRGEALLCELSSGASSCTDSKSKMAAGRADAAWACVETVSEGCKKLLIVGGRSSAAAPIAEIYNATNDSFEKVEIKGGPPPQFAHGGQLVRAGTRFYYVGGRGKALFLDAKSTDNAAPIQPLVIEVDTAKSPIVLTFGKVDLNGQGGADGGKRTFTAAIGYDDGSALVVGGLGADNSVGMDALLIGSDAKVKARVALEQPRYAAAIAKIEADGPLKGCAVLAGGISGQGPTAQPVNHVEVFCPEDD